MQYGEGYTVIFYVNSIPNTNMPPPDIYRATGALNNPVSF